MGSVGKQSTLTTRDIIDSMTGGDSYTSDASYRNAMEDSSKLFKEMQSLQDRERELREELKNESKPKPRSEWDDVDEIESLLGNRPMIYTERGEEIHNQLEEITDKRRDIERAWEQSTKAIKRVDEAQSDEQKYLYRIRPDSERTVSSDVKDSYKGFKVGETTTPYIDEMIKSGRAKVVEMSPKEYLQECAYNIFRNATLETTLRGVSSKAVQEYMGMMRSGVKFDTPYLNYKDQGQEGRHRAIAAYMLGIKRIPVVIVPKNS